MSSLVPGSRAGDGVEAEGSDAGQAGCAAIWIGVHDDLGAAGQRPVGDRVHVADDQVRPVSGLDQRVGAAVDAHHDRLAFADVGPQGGQVLAVAVAPHDDQGVPALEAGPQGGSPDAVDEQRVFVLDVLHRVGDELLDLGRQAVLRLGHGRGDRLQVLQPALGHDLLARVEGVPVEPHLLALA